MWFLFTIISLMFWGGADLFYKLGSAPDDKYSHLKIVVLVGITMGLHAFVYLLLSGINFYIINLVYYLPVSILYISSMTLGYIGLRYIELSLCSPICNSSGAVAFLLCFIFLKVDVSTLQISAVAAISLGLIFLSVFEKNKNKLNQIYDNDNKYRKGFTAILFPLMYCIIDGIGTFADAITLERIMDEEQALLSYEFTFLIAAIVALFFLFVVYKQKVAVSEQKERAVAAVFETTGQIFYIRAMSDNAVLAAPIIACYSIVSVLLSRFFLREKLTKVQYLIILFIIISIGILGIE